MRNIFMAIAAVAALSTPALAEPADYNSSAVEVGTGAAVGSVAGVGLSEGWFASGTSLAGAAATTAGAVTVGGVAGVGTVALLDSAIEPCSGFHALFGANHGACVNGTYVGYSERPARRVIR
jgi:hypothetical protein